MLIIVEGVDRVGKTTLCSMLKEKIGFPVFRLDTLYGIKDYRLNCEVNNCICQIEEVTSTDMVLDRYIMSEFVYGFYDRNRDGVEEYHRILGRMANLNTLLIFVRSMDIKESSRQHGKDLSYYEKTFSMLYDSWPLDKITTRYDTFDKTVECIKKRLGK